MSPRVTALSSILLLALAIPGVAQAAWPHDPTVNVPLGIAVGFQGYTAQVSDGSGGSIIAWVDGRSDAAGDVYIQRVNAWGVPQWTANGVALCNVIGEQNWPTIVSDGAGGAIVAWMDFRNTLNFDTYVQRVNGAGSPQWTANGVGLTTNVTGDQQYPTITTDGAGGAIVTWWDTRNGNNDIFAQRVIPNGTSPWAANGKAVCTNVSS